VRKLLLAVDCTSYSRRAAEYLATVAPHVPDCQVVLFSVMTGIPYNNRELEKLVGSASTPPEVHGDEDHQRELTQINTFFQEIAALLIASGFPAERLQTVAKPISRGVAQDIIDEAEETGCDTIVVGRRGLSMVREMLLGSVSSDLVHKAPLAVWVIE
jgi:nucleotide-binding universal stress UspA family protein